MKIKENGRGGWIRTNAWQDQNLLPYRLATPLYLLRCARCTVFLCRWFVSNRKCCCVRCQRCNALCRNARKFINFRFVMEAQNQIFFVLKQSLASTTIGQDTQPKSASWSSGGSGTQPISHGHHLGCD